ncbi:atrial natriuretic peptide receptor 3-like [Paramacrobiotus metropolitanus]|uniref:atrial natriuretic peptide receptor 3-like n=1 Tax=Paramacrobiotus metropolitanus TaxID=2943436 RepID=UPI0024458F2F|nr:atrial natriuretic peptide receptor 3-like [Paramacrobiotus metropolitanus]
MQIPQTPVTLFLVGAVFTTYASTLDIALMEFALTGRNPVADQSAKAAWDKGEELLRTNYGSLLNVTGERFLPNPWEACYDTGSLALNWAARYYYRQTTGDPVLAMIGSDCPLPAKSLANFATEWNIPIMTTNSGDSGFYDKQRYPTLTRLSPYRAEDVSVVLYKILSNFGYNTVGILCDGTEGSDRSGMFPSAALAMSVCRSVSNTLRDIYNISASWYYIQGKDRQNTIDSLEEIKAVARVVIVIAQGNRIRPIMLAASDMQMTNGEYVYFAFEPFRHPVPSVGNITWYSKNDGRDAEARLAFRSLFKISTSSSYEDKPEYRNFTPALKQLIKEKYGDPYYNGFDLEVSPFTMAYYYALSIYGQTLNEMATSGSGENLHDGAAVSRLMWNRTYTILGQEIFINATGDRQSDWILSQPDINGNFQPVMEYSARRRWLQPSRDPLDNSIRQIVWPNNRSSPPLNEPLCGYRGTKCTSDGRDKGGNTFWDVSADVLQGTASRQQGSPIQHALNSTVNLIQQFSSVLNQYRDILHI